MKTAVEDVAYWAVHITANMRVEFQVCLSDAEIDPTIFRMADLNCIVNPLEREMYGITSNDQMGFRQGFSIHVVEFEACWQAIGV
jgi:hypothetical protein